MTVLLGGRVAEELVFGAITTGASDDLRASPRSPTRWSTSTRWAPPSTARRAIADAGRVRPHAPQLRDEEQQRAGLRGAPRGEGSSRAHRAELDALAAELLEHEVLERDDIDRIMDGGRASTAPARRRRESRPRAAATAAEPARRYDSAPACSPGSTTSASPSRISTPRSRSTSATSRWSSSTARRSTSRAWRPSCSTSARTTSSCSRRSARTRRSGKFLAKKGPGLHHVAYQVPDIDAALDALGPRAALIDEPPRTASAARASRSCTRRRPAACSPRSSSPRRATDGLAQRISIGFQARRSLALRASGGLAWKPMLMRWAMSVVPLRGLDDLGQHAAGASRVQERHARAADAGARLLVDQPQAGCSRSRRSAASMSVHLVGDVVQARARAWPGTCPTGVSGPSGASSSTWFSPTSSSTASTPCSSTVSRWTSAHAVARARRARAPRRGPRRRRRCGRSGRTRAPRV